MTLTFQYTDQFAKQCEAISNRVNQKFVKMILRMTTIQILDIVLPFPAGCCGNRRWELKRKAFEMWILQHREMSDEMIIERLKKML